MAIESPLELPDLDGHSLAVRTDELDFDLPPDLIAQLPAVDRAGSRLLHYQRAGQSIGHRLFWDLPGLLRAGDLLVFNDARVLAARFMLRRNTGGRVQGLFLGQNRPGEWSVMLRNVGQSHVPLWLHFANAMDIAATVIAKLSDGTYRLVVHTDEPAAALLEQIGRMPLPPYIRRKTDADERDDLDRQRYQTVFGKSPGSIAAPTAGLHFTSELLEKLTKAGIEQTWVTLHVGMGTFKPVKSGTLEDHAMHVESYAITPAAADAIGRAKREKRRVIAIGTTAARVLESQPGGEIQPCAGQTGIFIYPPYQWKHVDALLTNFHLPRSTLIALVAALVGLGEQRRIYREAIERKYRFFSYGDAMLVE